MGLDEEGRGGEGWGGVGLGWGGVEVGWDADPASVNQLM